MKEIDVPTKVRDIRRFLVIINYYRDMWCKHERTLAPLKKLYSTKVKFKWNYVEQKYFTEMKKVLGCGILLSYPNFSEIFIIHTDARKMQPRRLIIRKWEFH